jgi:hypothetical protein
MIFGGFASRTLPTLIAIMSLGACSLFMHIIAIIVMVIITSIIRQRVAVTAAAPKCYKLCISYD